MTADTLHKAGHILFEFAGEPERMDVHIFRADSVHGTPTESDGESEGTALPSPPAPAHTLPHLPLCPAVRRIPITAPHTRCSRRPGKAGLSLH